jgi:hypothetical protein
MLIEKRVNELFINMPSSKLLASVMDQVRSKWIIIKELAIHECAVNEINLHDSLPIEERIISPSDFGFHNCIIKENKEIIFIDFEYAGWDDPAKMVCDFFNQVAVPIDGKYIDNFIEEFQSSKNNSQMVRNRIKLLLRAYRIKWCCIVLNVFINKNLERRIFANPNLNVSRLKSNQILKAKQILESIHI